jgi:arylsulfatase A
MHDYYAWRLEYGAGETVKRGDGRYLTDVWTEEAVGFLERHAGGPPFFLHVTYNAPHTPLQVPEEESRPFSETGRFNRGVSTLYGMIHRLDAGVARILEALRRLGLEENTIVVFTSDNGPQFGGQGEECLTRFNCQFNGAKGSVYEGGIRVPLLIRWPAGLPGVGPGGRRIDAMAHFCDWFPTLLSLAGVPVPPHLKLDGADLAPVLRGENEGTITRRFWQWNRYTPLATCNAAMRDGDWKLVRPAIDAAMQVPDIHWLRTAMYDHDYFVERGILREPDPPRDVPPPPPPELYHIAADPLEQRNLAAERPDVVRRMLRDLEAWFEEVEAERRTIRD